MELSANDADTVREYCTTPQATTTATTATCAVARACLARLSDATYVVGAAK